MGEKVDLNQVYSEGKVFIKRLGGVHIARFNRQMRFPDAWLLLDARGFTWGTAKYLVKLATNCPKEKRPFVIISVVGACGDYSIACPSLGPDDDEWDMGARRGDIAIRGAVELTERYIVIPNKEAK